MDVRTRALAIPFCVALSTGLAATLMAAGPLGAESAPPPVLDAKLDGRLHLPLAALAERAPLAPDESFRVVALGRDAHTSHHVVSIRDAETPHRHDRHDLLVVVLEGHGHMRLDDESRPVGEGSVLYVPRGTVHAFANAADSPAVAYAVYTPPFDGEDRVEVAGD